MMGERRAGSRGGGARLGRSAACVRMTCVCVCVCVCVLRACVRARKTLPLVRNKLLFKNKKDHTTNNAGTHACVIAQSKVPLKAKFRSKKSFAQSKVTRANTVSAFLYISISDICICISISIYIYTHIDLSIYLSIC